MLSNQKIQLLANSIKILSADAVEKAQSGHPGTPVGAAEIIATLFANHLNYNPNNPSWLNRDRFVLSAGHASMLQYATLYLLGYKHFTLDSIKNLRQINSITSGHPEIDHEAGIEVTTGPLGEGVAMAVGIALAERNLNARYGDAVSNYTYAFVGDGCLMEGVSYEALSLAGTLGLSKLIVIYDNNNITIDGSLSLSNLENIALRMEAMHFNVIKIDGHNIDDINAAFIAAKKSDKPIFILAKTIIGKGAGNKENLESAHGSPFGAENISVLRKNLGWTLETPFEVPQEVLDIWHTVAEQKRLIAEEWDLNFSKNPKKQQLLNQLNKTYSDSLNKDLKDLSEQIIKDKKAIATRVASSKVLEIIKKNLKFVIGGSADLSNSNNTITISSKVITKEDFSGNYIHYGVREHGMGAIMLGMASYGAGIIPYGGTFLIFSDFMRPTIRLAALMQQQVIFVFTHDNISIGGDGPTHQPIEQLASLRLIPNLNVIRPADTIETIEAYQIALEDKNKPTAIVLGRNPVDTLRDTFSLESNMSKFGAYLIYEQQNAKINLLSSGSELSLTFKVKDALEKEGIAVSIISVPSLVLFKQQSSSYKQNLLKDNLNIVIEAAELTGWKDVLGSNTLLYGLTTFGKSGNPDDVMESFGFTVDKIVKFIINNTQ